MNLAIFGGTFDPIHKGHLAIASTAAARFSLDRVLFVPAARPPHKAGVTSAPYEHRIRMAELACADFQAFEVSRLEEGTTYSYTIVTIGKVRARLAPADELFFLIGADAFAEIKLWYRWRSVLRDVRFIVASRPGHVYDVPAEARVDRLDTTDLPISSSGIRQALAAGERPTAVPAAVMDYILAHGLYGAPVTA